MNVILIAATTADGFIGRDAGHTADWTGQADKQVFVRLTKEAGTIVMGRATFDTIGRALPGRRNIVYTSQPQTISAPGIESTSEPPAKLLARLESEGVTGVAICGGRLIYTQFLQAGLVNELYLTVIPTLFGQGLSLFNAPTHTKLELVDTTPLDGGAVLLHYKLSD